VIWSKLKKTVESLLADSVREHLQVHLTRYGSGNTYFMTRAWVTWDGEEIGTFSAIKYWNEQKRIASLLSEESGSDSGKRFAYLEHMEHARTLLEQDGLYPTERFLTALEMYISLSIEDALCSSDILIRAWSMFDRRLGKRRLRAMDAENMDRAFEQRWYRLRCGAEGIRVEEPVDDE